MSLRNALPGLSTKHCVAERKRKQAHLVYAVHADEHGKGHSYGDESPQQAHVQLVERSIVGKGVQHRSYHTRPGLA